MKAAVLALSLVLNTGLFSALAWRPDWAPVSIRDFLTQTFHARAEPPPIPAARPKPPPRTKLWLSLDTGGDLPGLIARLRAAGFPANIIRSLISAEIGERYEARSRALTEPDPNAPFWKPKPTLGMNTKTLEDYFQIQRERAKVLRDLFSDPFFATDDAMASQRRKFGDLSPQKIDLVQRIEDDYADMTSQVRTAMNGVTLPADRDQLALLAREKQTDLAGVLAPDELADYQLRSSQLTQMLASRLAGFDPSETEFRAVFAAQQAFGQTVAPGGSFNNALSYEDRTAAQQQLADTLKASLGAARYADYLRETDSTYQQLTRLTQNTNVTPDALRSVYSLRDSVSQESNQIYDDASLTREQKTAALQSLAQTTRGQILATLGPTAGAAYVATINQQWLNRVEQGAAVSISDQPAETMSFISDSSGAATLALGTTLTFRSLPRRAPPHP